MTKEIQGIIAVIRATEAIDFCKVSEALIRGGVSILEVTLNTPNALLGIYEIERNFGQCSLVGAGTVLNSTDARIAIEAGAKFIVTPTLQPKTIALCQASSVPIVCGAMTPTEIQTAHEAGADFVKLFPAGVLGLEFIKAVLAPLPFIRFVPTGGVSLENIREFLQICTAVGIGGNLVSTKLISEGRWDELSVLARSFVEAASA